MCGIVGYCGSAAKPSAAAIKISEALVKQSKIRGLHACGISYIPSEPPRTLTTAKWIGEHGYTHVTEHLSRASLFICHLRYSTSGDFTIPQNNQPIDIGGISVVANSVLSMKPKSVYEPEFGVKCTSDNDTEIFARILEQGKPPEAFIRDTKGSFAGMWIKGGKIYAARNSRRPLWYFRYGGNIWIASTVDIIRRALRSIDSEEGTYIGESIEATSLAYNLVYDLMEMVHGY